MKHLPGPDQMPERWFHQLLGTIPTPSTCTPEQLLWWRESWRPYARQLWAEAWLAGAAYQDATSRREFVVRSTSQDADQLVERFRKQLEGLPDGTPEG